MAKSQKQREKRGPHTDAQILLFIVALCFICAFLLSVVAYALAIPQKNAKDFDQSKQMLIAAKILNHDGHFEILQEEGETVLARYDSAKKILVPSAEKRPPLASDEAIREIANLRIRPLLTNEKGEVFTFEEKNVNLSEYLEKNKKVGYARQPLKLFYAILPNEPEAKEMTAEEIAKDLSQAYGLVFPVSGFGLWAPIYGFISLEPNGDTVIGTTWYEQAETPGLGANISESWWQEQFYGKEIFQQTTADEVDVKTAEMGIIVVKGQVRNVFGTSPRAKSAVDGISGATLTGDGVTAAYRNSLTPYRSLLIKLKEETSDE